ncbi:esterase E4-like [Panulirus ornatus]|uniref:esterase E4-like n=1 Tax=Panulirus ornatus TaxID=150431 RepID=UPI003A852BBD
MGGKCGFEALAPSLFFQQSSTECHAKWLQLSQSVGAALRATCNERCIRQIPNLYKNCSIKPNISSIPLTLDRNTNQRLAKKRQSLENLWKEKDDFHGLAPQRWPWDGRPIFIPHAPPTRNWPTGSPRRKFHTYAHHSPQSYLGCWCRSLGDIQRESEGEDNRGSDIHLHHHLTSPPRASRILTGQGGLKGPGAEERTADLQRVDLPTNLGVITGTQEFTEQPTSRPFFAFRGIPFAQAPVGRLRWADPEDLEGPWPGGHLDATKHRHFCPQYDYDTHQVVGNEDCLYLSVYTPLLPSQTPERLPVLFFLHGGGYLRGSATSLGPQKLMKEDIVLVTANYRLGALGFLSTRDTSLPGNYGALDQIAALRWVSTNIAQFGGDPVRVTLGGFSAGASFVHLHMLSPLSRDLFSGAIMMSGAGNCLWSVAEEPEEVAYDLAWDLDCSTWSSYTIKDCLQDKSATEIIQAQSSRYRYVFWPMLYRPVVDGGFRELPFLPEPLVVLMSRPPLHPVPLLLGGVPDEGILFALTAIIFSESGSSPSQLYEEATRYTVESIWPNTSTSISVADSIISFYYTHHARENLDTLAEEMSETFTDLLFTSCMWDAAAYFASSSRAPVYTYLMRHRDPGTPSYAVPLYQLAEGKGVRSSAIFSGISHGDDLALVFSLPYNLGQPGPRDVQISSLLTFMWATFVHTGSPQGANAVTSGMPVWTPLVPGEPVTYYTISFTPGMSFTPFRYKERNLWQQTLRYVDDVLETSYAYYVATWVLLALILLLLLLLVVVCVGVWVMRRRDKYPGGSLTLRSRISRNPSASSSSLE